MKNNLSRLLMVLAGIVLLMVFLFPLWTITLEAPQYPEGISMYIWINQITGDSPSTLQNINILNHYIGMQFITPESIPELKYFPYVVYFMSFMALVVAFINKRPAFLVWAIVLAILGALGVYDFYLWEYDYGHNLDENAAIKIPGMVYQPPLLGTKMLLNFKATSLPNWGSVFLGISILLSFFAFIKAKKVQID